MSLLLKKRVSVMDETLLLFNSLKTEICFSRSDIVKIFYSFSKDDSMKNLIFLDSFSELYENNDFHFIWRECISAFPYYKSEERDKMLQFGSFLGTTDSESQISTINLYISYFENYRVKAIAENEKYGKIAPLFGLFFGASMFILLI